MSFIVILNLATSSWGSEVTPTLYTLLILGYRKSFGIPIHMHTFRSTRVSALLAPLLSHLSIAILAWSLEDGMTWSPSHIYFFISSGVACHGRVWSLTTGASSKGNKGSPCLPCSKSSHWSFARSLSTA